MLAVYLDWKYNVWIIHNTNKKNNGFYSCSMVKKVPGFKPRLINPKTSMLCVTNASRMVLYSKIENFQLQTLLFSLAKDQIDTMSGNALMWVIYYSAPHFKLVGVLETGQDTKKVKCRKLVLLCTLCREFSRIKLFSVVPEISW